MKKLLKISSLVFIISLLTSCGKQKLKGYHSINIATLQQEVIGKDVQFIDVRTEAEYANGHIDDAVNINVLYRREFKEKVAIFDIEKPIYVYCMSGGRSYHACKILNKLGFKTINDFTGGWNEWNKHNDEIVNVE